MRQGLRSVREKKADMLSMCCDKPRQVQARPIVVIVVNQNVLHLPSMMPSPRIHMSSEQRMACLLLLSFFSGAWCRSMTTSHGSAICTQTPACRAAQPESLRAILIPLRTVLATWQEIVQRACLAMSTTSRSFSRIFLKCLAIHTQPSGGLQGSVLLHSSSLSR